MPFSSWKTEQTAETPLYSIRRNALSVSSPLQTLYKSDQAHYGFEVAQFNMHKLNELRDVNAVFALSRTDSAPQRKG